MFAWYGVTGGEFVPCDFLEQAQGKMNRISFDPPAVDAVQHSTLRSTIWYSVSSLYE